jgi:hypothetical protein
MDEEQICINDQCQWYDCKMTGNCSKFVNLGKCKISQLQTEEILVGGK